MLQELGYELVMHSRENVALSVKESNLSTLSRYLPSSSSPWSPPFLSSSSLARSPLYSHISATLQGLTTIRACEREHASIAYFHAYQDEQTKGWHHYLIANRWFGMRIDLISSLFISIVSFSAIPLAGGECCQWVAKSLYRPGGNF